MSHFGDGDTNFPSEAEFWKIIEQNSENDFDTDEECDFDDNDEDYFGGDFIETDSNGYFESFTFESGETTTDPELNISYDEIIVPVDEDSNVQHDLGAFNSESKDIDPQSNEFKDISWEESNLQVQSNEVAFLGSEMLPPDVLSLRTPCDFFTYFVTDVFLTDVANQTKLYAQKSDPTKQFEINIIDLKKFIGILIFMSVYEYPNVRSYWGRYSFNPIHTTMTVNQFEEIRRFLHFADSMPQKDDQNYDVLHKLRPIIEHFNERFSSIPMKQRVCVDEQMCATKMTKTTIRQYMPNKPHKWGFKLFVLCDTSGFSHAFEIYTGKSSNVVPEGAPDLGVSSNIVVRLSQKMPDNINHIMYFDNFYTSLPLLIYLRSRGIFSLGTIRKDRIPNSKLSAKVEGQARGYTEEFLGVAYGCQISTVLWNDTKPVRLASTYAGIKAFSDDDMDCRRKPKQLKRWDKATKQHVIVDCPLVISEYNQHMGGVDLMDGLIGRYRIRMKTTKWTNRLFYHLIDMALVNAYILYRRVKVDDKIGLPEFRSSVAEALCFYASGTLRRVGRPSATPKPLPNKATKTQLPIDDVRYDGFNHWCKFLDITGKKTCKNPGCKSRTQSFCTKCKLNLCNTPGKDCFIEFHTPE